MKESRFIGRKNELKKFESLFHKKSASLVVIRGRRRIGKSRLVEEFGKKYQFFQFSGLAPISTTTAQSQRDEFARQLSYNTGLPELRADGWSKLFHLLSTVCEKGKIVVFFDEISWMGSKDPDFLGKIKNAWDLHFKKNPELILILCGSVSSWIEENILKSTGFVGRISLRITLNELSLSESDEFLESVGFRGSVLEKFRILSVVGGVPKYLEEIDPYLSAEKNIKKLCFDPTGLLFNEFNDIFTDLFSKRTLLYKDIVSTLVDGPKDLNSICDQLNLSKSGNVSHLLEDLVLSGFVSRNYTWHLKDNRESRLSHYRLSDNYIRFYLKYVEPDRNRIERGHYEDIPLGSLPSWNSIMGLQFENLVLNNRNEVIRLLNLSPQDILSDNPFFQRKTALQQGCQIDYLIHTRFNNLYPCEIKFHNAPLGSDIIADVSTKFSRLRVPKGFAVLPILIHVNGVSEEVQYSPYFYRIIDFSELLTIRG